MIKIHHDNQRYRINTIIIPVDREMANVILFHDANTLLYIALRYFFAFLSHLPINWLPRVTSYLHFQDLEGNVDIQSCISNIVHWRTIG